ncbi:MAG TPA: hypothetical protein ENH62_09200 [Marinobacter sp.]|uniref:Uncharacterized protein n=1 Tax=marine sediment metagenome TaxID=412755 RepID=A0A0F9TPJ2_9ZZZZ|nr:hypothetical protein [Marinobacter sp.]
MGDRDPFGEGVQESAVEGEPSPFDKVLLDVPARLSIDAQRIPYKNVQGNIKFITLDEPSKYHQIIFSACAASIQSDWFSGISNRSRPSYLDSVRKLFDWINDSGRRTSDKTRYTVLKDYESFRMNDLGNKRSPLEFLNSVLQQGQSCYELNRSDYEYLRILLSLSRPAQHAEISTYSLSNWFDLPWLRSVIGEQTYLQLESPRLLFKSFRVTIATTLMWLLDKSARWKRSSVIEFCPSYTDWQYDWNRLVLERDGIFNDAGKAVDEFSELLLLDLIKPSQRVSLEKRLAYSGTRNLPRKFTVDEERFLPWQVPVFFHPAYQTGHSPLEELLCAWLVACEAIQASDIPKLKVSNYARESNSLGRMIAMECNYYKGRAGAFRQPAILMGNDLWTRALDHFMAGLPSSSLLFKTRVDRGVPMAAGALRHNATSLLCNIWRLPTFKQRLRANLKRAGATPLFVRTMLALEEGSESVTSFRKKTGKKIEDYRASVARPLPERLFALTHIKTTAVHAESDAYRESDLINHHSHSALTEKTSYMTDSNKEWVNQSGRITRLVLHDLQHVVFQPSVEAISNAVNDLHLQTRILEATQTDDVVTHSLSGSVTEANSEDTVVVSDTTDTALYFLHYLAQAEVMLPKLLHVRPDWVERTLIVQVEWMTRTLNRMRASAAAKKVYAEVADQLPPLFEHLLETTE